MGKQLNKKVKVVSSDWHGEHDENFDKNGQNPGPFTKLFQS